MKAIHKYFVANFAESIVIPCNYIFRAAAIQKGKMCVWAEVDPNSQDCVRRIVIKSTGSEIKDGSNYISTVFDDMYVWHLYEEVK